MSPHTIKILFRIAQAILVVVFLAQGGMKLLGLPFEIAAFARWGYSVQFMYGIGTLEVLGALTLLTPWRAWGVMGLIIIMVGAIYTHFASGEAPMSGLAILMFFLLLGSSWLKKKMRAA